MAISGLDIYKLLPKTNCKECGFATCLAFAMQLAKKAVSIDKCPYIGQEAKRILNEASLPPIRLLTIGKGDNKLEVGNETVMFRHEEKFHHPCGIGFIIEDSLSDNEIKETLKKINTLSFERVGQKLEVNLVAIRQNKDKTRFIEAVKLTQDNTNLGLVLMSSETEALEGALKLVTERRPLIYTATKDNFSQMTKLAKEYKSALAVTSPDLDGLVNLTKEINGSGLEDLAIDTGNKSLSEKIWDFTQIRKQALKKANRNLGYPILSITESSNPYEEAIEAATYISKYSEIVLLKGIDTWEILALLTLRQNVYTDPQKPLQIESKLYSVGMVNEKSPVLVTTNFSLTYYTVMGEVEASKIPSYILSVDTEGMSVLTAWAAEKFTPEKIADTINKFEIKKNVAHNRLIIPGYVAVMSGELEDKSGWQITVGPKEAAGIPSFLKNL